MNKLIPVIGILLLLSSCSDKEDITIENLETFTSEHFKQFEGNSLNAYDAAMLPDESIIIVGNGMENGSFGIKPFFLKIGADKEISKEVFLESDENSLLYKPIDLLPTQDGNYIYLSSRTADFSSDTDIDIKKMNEDGEVEWQKRVGEELKNEKGKSIVEIPNDGYVILSFDHQALSFPDKFLVTRVSGEGELVWSKVIEEIGINGLEKILYLSEDQTILVLNEHGVGVGGNRKAKITKLDLDGNIISTKLVLDGDDYFPGSSDMKILRDGNVLVYFSSIRAGSSNSHGISMIKLDAELNEIWSRRHEEIRSNIVCDILESSDGEMIILSKSSRINNDEFDVVLSKMDSDGVILWNKSYGSPSSDQGHRVHEKANKNLLIVGNSNHDTGSESRFEIFLLETNSDGIPE